MKKLVLVLALCLPAWGTVTLVQSPACNASCSGTTCAVTTSSTGTGNVIAAVALLDTTGTQATITGVSGGGTYSDGGACGIANGTTNSVDCWYTLNSTSGSTSTTITISPTQTGWRACIREFSSSLGAMSLDTVNSRTQTTTTNPAGVTLTLTGSNDAIVQFTGWSGTASSISSPYDTATDDYPAGNGLATAINTGSGTAPTWTATSGNGALGAIAFKEAASGATPTGNKADKLQNLEGAALR